MKTPAAESNSMFSTKRKIGLLLGKLPWEMVLLFGGGLVLAAGISGVRERPHLHGPVDPCRLPHQPPRHRGRDADRLHRRGLRLRRGGGRAAGVGRGWRLMAL